jgi:alkanesulfonate monooxygenase SsuD/methylene tetrahydromethanopterin reductase-like flavin-dependent oxidoreductase (luciferase family)
VNTESHHLPALGLHVQLPAHPEVPPAQRFRDTIEQAVIGDALGFESIWPVEQHFDPDVSMLSAPLLLLAAIAERTTHLRLGTAILLAPLHHPLRLASELATLDVLSGGRVECGLGRGMDPVHFARFGLVRPDGHDHLDGFVGELRRAWTDRALGVQPVPLQLPHPPIRIAANSLDTFRHAGRTGMPILAATHVNPPAQLRELVAVYRQEQAAAGHPRRDGDVTVLSPVFTHRDPRRLRRLVEPGVARITAAIHRKLAAAAAAVPAGDGRRAGIDAMRARLADLGYDTMVARRMAVFATPAAAAAQVHELATELGADRVVCWTNPGGLIPGRDVIGAMEHLAEHAIGARATVARAV